MRRWQTHAVRVNLVKALLYDGHVGKKALQRDWPVGAELIKKASNDLQATGLQLYSVDGHGGRQAVSKEMKKRIHDFVLDPVNGFTKTLPQSEFRVDNALMMMMTMEDLPSSSW